MGSKYREILQANKTLLTKNLVLCRDLYDKLVENHVIGLATMKDIEVSLKSVKKIM